MRLVEGQRPGRMYNPYIVPEIDADELIGDEGPASSPSYADNQPTTIVETVTPPEEPAPATEEVVSPNPEIDTTATPEETSEEPAPSPAAESDSPTEENQSAETSSEKKPRKGRSRRRRSRKRNRKGGSPGGSDGG